MKVVVYRPTYNDKHREILAAFAAGVPGAELRNLEDYKPHDGVAVVFGWYKTAYPPTMLKRTIALNQRHKLIVIESGFVKRGEYYQIGWNGFAGWADFRTDDKTPMDRWEQLGIEVHPWRRNEDGKIVVCGQLPRDTQVQDVNHVAWCQRTVSQLRHRYGDRVRFRPHPRVRPKDAPERVYGIDPAIMDERPLEQLWDDAAELVTWNSTTATEAVINGVPVRALNRGSMAWPIAAHSLEEPLVRPDRRTWLAGLGYSMWNLDEMKEGLPWYHLTEQG